MRGRNGTLRTGGADRFSSWYLFWKRLHEASWKRNFLIRPVGFDMANDWHGKIRDNRPDQFCGLRPGPHAEFFPFPRCVKGFSSYLNGQ